MYITFNVLIYYILGVTVWELLTFGAKPYPGIKAHELLAAIYKGVRLEQPQTCSSDMYTVLLKCEFVI